jgi:thioredoxin 1
MSVICICGICIPYSVFWPLIVIACREIYNFLFGKKSLSPKEQVIKELEENETSVKTQPVDYKGGSFGFLTTKMLQDKGKDSFSHLLHELSHPPGHPNHRHPLFLKFTAKWCKPCKEIDPFFNELAEKHSSQSGFLSIDVDEFDEIAAEYFAITIPHLVAIDRNGKNIDSMSGKDTEKIRLFIEKHLPVKTD